MTMDLGPPGYGEVGRDLHPPRAIERCSEGSGEGRGVDSGGPHHRLAGEPIAAHLHSRGVDPRHQGARPDLHAEGLELSSRLVGKILGIGRQDPWPRLHENHPGGAGVDAPEVAAKRVPRDLRERSRHLHSGGSAPDDHEGEPAAALLVVRLALGPLEGEKGAAANLQGVVEGLEPGRETSPRLVAEVGVGGPGRHHQVIVGDLRVGEHHAPALGVDRGDVGQENGRVPLPRRIRRIGAAISAGERPAVATW